MPNPPQPLDPWQPARWWVVIVWVAIAVAMFAAILYPACRAAWQK